FGSQHIPAATEPGSSSLGRQQGAALRPARTRTFEAHGRDLFASALHGATADEVAELAEAGIVHAMLVVRKVGDGFVNSRLRLRRQLLAGMDQLIDLSFPQEAARIFEPGLIPGCAWREGRFGNGRQIFTGMVPI